MAYFVILDLLPSDLAVGFSGEGFPIFWGPHANFPTLIFVGVSAGVNRIGYQSNAIVVKNGK